MLFTPVKAFSSPGAHPCTVPCLCSIPPSLSGLPHVLLLLGSPPRSLRVWLGHLYYIHSSLFISNSWTSIHRKQAEVLYYHIARPMGGLSWAWFSSSKSLLGKLSPNTGRCLGAGPSIFLRQKHDFLASFNSSNVFKSKHIQHQLLLL